MEYLDEFHLSLTVDDVLRGQGGDPQVIRHRKPVLTQAAERAHRDGMSLLHPVALTQKVIVHSHRHERILLEGGSPLTGPLVTAHLAGAEYVVAVVCTIGSELEKTVFHLLNDDPMYALAMDGLGNAAVELLAQQVCAYIAEQVQEGMQLSTPISPGNPEWPVDVGQPQIFSLVDPTRAGITLTSGGMMLPKKSMSFIVGLGLEMSQANLCEVCSLKETCRYQHA